MSDHRPTASTARRFVVVVPVKPPALGKSRLGGLGDAGRRRLATAFALDTVSACLAARSVEHVLVATDDAAFSSQLTRLGCAAVPDGDTSDLNATLRQTAAEARRRWPALTPVALCADLPALRPDHLDEALGRATELEPHRPSFVTDAAGVGTTLYTSPHEQFDPRFGAASRDAHLREGALELEGGLATLRRDVDDLDDLRVAAHLGLGPRTAEVVEELGLP